MKNIDNKKNGGSKKYNIEAICNSVVYANKLKSYPPGLYYLVL